MTTDPTPAPDAAVQIAADAIGRVAYGRYDHARAIVAALSRAEMICAPGTAGIAAAAREYVRELDKDGPRDSGVKVYRAMQALRAALSVGPPPRDPFETAAALDAAPAGTTAEGESGACGCTLGPDRGDGEARGFNPCPEHANTGPRDFEG